MPRLTRWVEGFAERHGEASWARDGTAYLLTAIDGSWARLSTWNPAGDPPPDLERWAAPPRSIGLVLIRRGGYAVGRGEGERLAEHKTGTRYVQARTAAGGWSQQRYARRRAHQAQGLVAAAAEAARRVLLADPPEALVLGGDRGLGQQLMTEPGLTGLTGLPRRDLPDISDPRLGVLQASLTRARSVLVTVRNREGS